MTRTILAFVSALACFSALSSAGPLEDLKPGEWYEAPASHLESARPDSAAPGNLSAVMDAWSGGAFDSKRGRLLIWGGGHSDYAGNELYAFDVETLKWSRLSEPSRDVGGTESSGVYPDGLPRSRHTYNSLQYLPAVDRLCAFGAAGMYPSGQTGSARTDCFDFASGKWARMADSKTYGIANFSAVDAATGAAWAGKGALTRFDPKADAWGSQTAYDNDIEWTNYLTAEIDPARRLLIAMGDGKLYQWDLSDTGAPASRRVATVGDTSILAAEAPGLAYDPIAGNLVAWAGGGDVFSLEWNSKTWTRHRAASAVVPTSANGNGTYGRFRYVPGKDVFIAVNRTNEDVFFYKPVRSGDAIRAALPPGALPNAEGSRAPILRGRDWLGRSLLRLILAPSL